MITVYLHANGTKVKVVQKGVTKDVGEIYKVESVRNVQEAKNAYATYLQALALGEEIDDMLDKDPDTFTRLKVALRKVSLV